MDGQKGVNETEEKLDGTKAVEHRIDVVVNKKRVRERQAFVDILDRWMFMHLMAIVFFSVAAAVVFMHTGLLWYQYMYGRTYRPSGNDFYVTQESVSVFRNPSDQCNNQPQQQQHQQLVVNTSLYFW